MTAHDDALVEKVADAIVRRQNQIYARLDEGFRDLDAEDKKYAKDVARAALSAMPPLAEQWRPISEAPKDGTRILVWLSYRPVVALFNVEWCQNHGSFNTAFDSPPKWWVPLPAPPAGEKEG